MKIIKLLLISAVITLSAVSAASAQETSVGVQYVRNNPTTTLNYQPSTDSIGIVASVTSYQTKNIGITGEGSANFGNSNGQFYTAMGGVTVKSKRFTYFQPYVKGLAGVGVLRVRKNGVYPTKSDASAAFKLAIGVDSGKGHYKWRNEVGYVQSDLLSNNQNFVTISTGIVF